MPTYSDTKVDLVINRLTKTQFESATGLDPTQEYHVDPEFTGGKLLETTADGDIVESSKTIPTKTSDLTNDSGFITGITSSDVTTALGYTPYDASNPNGYTSNTGTVTSVNNVSPVNGNVSLSIPTVNNPTITLTQGGVTKGSFTLNQSTGNTIALDAVGSVKMVDLFDHKWSDYQLNDQSWLRADTFSWQDGTVYSDAYDHLVDDYTNGTSETETVGSYTITYKLATDGHKICLSDQETAVLNIYNESGVAWYYILDTVNTRFKLPRVNPAREELIQVVRAKGNGMTLGFTNGIDNMAIVQTSSSSTTIGLANTAYGKNVYSAAAGESGWTTGIYGITTDPTKSGIISFMTDSTSVYKGKKYLYFYVGQFSQTATEQTAGLNSELFNGKADVDLSNAASNASATAKQTIVGWGMPDYTAGVSKTDNTEYIADTNGWLEICTSCFNSSVSATLTINGISRNIGICPSGLSINYSISPIARGDVYKVVYARADAYQYINFYPCIGG